MRKYDELGDAMRDFFLFAMFCLLLGAGTAAQGEPGHPKIGLVLSGGGARGLAHIGVLKALEDAHIPIDAIAGTSMGAVIGGLYASGYSADEIAHLAQTVDWGSLLSDTPPRKDIPFRRKQDDRLYLVKNGLNFRSDGTIGLPRGVIQGQNLSLTLEKLLVRSATAPDFDHLPIPFRAVAADIVHDQKVVFSKGHLPQALLASAAIPGVFAPVEVNGRLLVDGGMVDSLPVDVARQMGVDVVIAVDIGAPLRSRTQLRNVLDILSQSVTIVSRRNTEAQIATLKSTDVLLRPNLEGYGFADFANAKQIIEVGYQAAKASQDRLLALRRPATRPATALASNTPPAPLIINNIRIINNSSVSDAVIRDKIHQNVGQPLDLDQLQKDMGTLYGLDYFEQVRYQVEPENGGNTLVIDARQKRDGIDYLRLGVNLSDDFKGEGVYNIGVSFRKNGINRLGAEWLTRLQLGDEQEFFTEFYQPLDAGSRWFVAPNLFAESRNIDNTLNNDPVSRYRLSRYGYALNLGRQINNNGELRFGIGQDWGHSRPRIGPRDLPEENFDEGFYDLRYSFDTEDNVDYPLHGERIDAHMRIFDESLGSDDGYRQWQLSVEKPLTFGPNTFLLGGQYARTGGGHPNLISSTMLLGGAQQLSGFRKDSLSGQNLGLARLIYYRRINSPSLLPLDYPLYLGASLEHGRIWNNDNDFDSGGINAASLFLGYLTPFGPMNVSFGFNDESERALYFNLGRSF